MIYGERLESVTIECWNWLIYIETKKEIKLKGQLNPTSTVLCEN